jgi:LemA protein
MTGLIVLLLALILLIGYTVMIYNGLVRTRNAVKLAWSNIDVLLVQRHDELPKLIEVCKQYMQYERDTLERVTQARSEVETARQSGDVGSVSPTSTPSRSAIRI